MPMLLATSRRTASLIRAAKAEFDIPPLPEDFAESLVGVAAEPSRPRRTRLAWALGGSGLAALVALQWVLRPGRHWSLRPVPALVAYQRVLSAADGVRTFHTVQWFQHPGGERWTQELWHESGKFRMQTSQGEIQVFDGKRRHLYRPDMHLVVRNAGDRPFGTPFRGFTVTAMLQVEGKAEVSATQVRGERGRLLNRFEVNRERERLVILADPRTDLPVATEISLELASGWERVGGTDLLEYNKPLSPDLFVLTPPEGVPVVDQEEVGREWLLRYERGLDTVQIAEYHVVLRDVQVTTQGDVRVAWSGGPELVTYARPGSPTVHTIEATLTDNESNAYLSGGVGSEGPDWRYRKAWFIPLRPLPAATRPYTLTIALNLKQQDGSPRRGQGSFTIGAPPPPTDIVLERSLLDPSSGSVKHVLDRRLADKRASLRAEYWREHGDPRQALQYYEELIASMDQEPGGRYAWDPPHWLIVGQLYERIGEADKAREAYQRGLESDKGEDWDPGHKALNAIKEALAQLR